MTICPKIQLDNMEILKKFSIEPNDSHLFELAFIHETYSHENKVEGHYERLEFLGDAVLDLIISEYLYNTYHDLTEGQLTRIRSNYVCKQALYAYSKKLGLEKYIKLGSGLELSRREIDSVIANVFESFVGALYLDQGLEVAKEFLYKTVIPHIENEEVFFYDYKSQLKELCDQKYLDVTYELIEEEGEPHNKTFTMAAMINDKICGIGSGGSKKEAEQNAAKTALNNF